MHRTKAKDYRLVAENFYTENNMVRSGLPYPTNTSDIQIFAEIFETRLRTT